MKVALVNMPTAVPNIPSIQLGILKTLLNRLGISSDTYNLNIEYARRLGVRGFATYAELALTAASEHWFARNLWGDAVDLREGEDEASHQNLTDQFVKDMLEFPWGDYEVIGFTATFQSTPALCLGYHIKKSHPGVTLMYGGSSFFESAALEYMKHCDWVDYTFVGEAEYSFLVVMECLCESRDLPEGLKGVIFRRNGELVFNGADQVDIEDSPCPDYSDFFDQLKDNGDVIRTAYVPYEASRGCWYGEMKHCTFCSLNHIMTFRSKDPDMVYEDIGSLFEKWSEHFFYLVFSDNILDKSYLKTLLPRLSKFKDLYKMRLLGEIKPDMKPHEIRILSEAGFRMVQTGIENFHPGFLKLLAKAQSILRMISALKWCSYYGIYVTYNLLHGIPFEQEEWYEEQFEVIKKISHLRLPGKLCAVSLQRFGVYYQQNLLKNMTPIRHYRYFVPKHMDLNQIAYYFEYDESVLCKNHPIGPTEQFIEEDPPPRRRILRFQTDRLIVDRRKNNQTKSYEISESQFELLKFCVIPQSLREIRKRFSEADIEVLESYDVLLCMEGKALSLVELTKEDVKHAYDTDVSLPVSKKV